MRFLNLFRRRRSAPHGQLRTTELAPMATSPILRVALRMAQKWKPPRWAAPCRQQGRHAADEQRRRELCRDRRLGNAKLREDRSHRAREAARKPAA